MLVCFVSNMFDILSEVYIQYMVCFVEDQCFNCAVIEVFFFYVLQQMFGCGDYDVLIFVEYFCVVYIGYVVGDGGDIQMCMFCQFVGMIGYLYCQFVSWGED